MVADLLQGEYHLQDDSLALEQRVRVVRLLAHCLFHLEFLHKVLERFLVKGGLRLGEFGVLVLDNLVRKVADDALVGLESAQHEGRGNLSECFCHPFVAEFLDGRLELLAEFGRAREESAVREVHDGPEFHEAVFDGRAAHRDFHGGAHPAQQPTLLAVRILDVLRLVNDDGLPRAFVQFFEVLAEGGVGREQYVGIELLEVAASAVVGEERKFWRELLDFDLPVAQQARGHYHERLLFGQFAFFVHLEEERDDLQCLSEAHVVGKDAAETDFEVLIHPRVAAHLVGAHGRVQVFG